MPLLKIGDIIELKKGHKVYADIPFHFVADNQIGNFELTHERVVIGEDRKSNNIKHGLNTDFMIGQWIVYKASKEGGGYGYARGDSDAYPDGDKVFCCKMETEKDKHGFFKNDYVMKIDFFQTGSFTAMIREDEIEVIGHIPFEKKETLSNDEINSYMENIENAND